MAITPAGLPGGVQNPAYRPTRHILNRLYCGLAVGCGFVSGYVVADVTWTDEEGRREYVELIGPSLSAHGGEVVAATRDVEVMEGDWQPGDVTVLISFPTRQAALTWYHSVEYSRALDIRKRSSHSRLMILGE